MIFQEGVVEHFEYEEGVCLEKFKEFKALGGTQSEHKMKAFGSDNGRIRRFMKWHREATINTLYVTTKRSGGASE